jgi:hypothetical protein
MQARPAINHKSRQDLPMDQVTRLFLVTRLKTDSLGIQTIESLDTDL